MSQNPSDYPPIDSFSPALSTQGPYFVPSLGRDAQTGQSAHQHGNVFDNDDGRIAYENSDSDSEDEDDFVVDPQAVLDASDPFNVFPLPRAARSVPAEADEPYNSSSLDDEDEEDDDLDSWQNVRSKSTPRSTGRAGRPRGRARGRPRTAAPAPRFRGARAGYFNNVAPKGERGRGPSRLGKPHSINPGPRFKALQKDANRAFLEGRFEEAEEACQQAIRLNPEVYAPYGMLATIYDGWLRPAEAVNFLFIGAMTRPRDAEVWWRAAHRLADLAAQVDDPEILSRLQICYSSILTADKTDITARKGRLDTYVKQGQSGKAVSDCRLLLEHDPYDLDCLNIYARESIALGQEQAAKDAYKSAILHFQAIRTIDTSVAFSWSDLSVYIDLYVHLEEHADGIMELKQIARWLIGRGAQTYWDDWQDDDREWDEEHKPRRTEVPQFRPEDHSIETYGYGLPPDVRSKLGVLRLKNGNVEEALKHFNLFTPEARDDDSPLYEFADAFREVADALHEAEEPSEALRFYTALSDARYLFRDLKRCRKMASCLEKLGRVPEATECVKHVVDLQPGSWEDRIELARLYELQGDDQSAFVQVQMLVQEDRHDELRKSNLKTAAHLKAHKSRRTIAREKRNLVGEALQERQRRSSKMKSHRSGISIEGDYIEMQRLAANLDLDDAESVAEYLDVAVVVAYSFMHLHEVAAHATKRDILGGGSSSFTGRRIVPTYVSVSYEEWLDTVCQVALVLAHNGEGEAAFQLIERTDRVPEFCQRIELMEQAHHCEVACAMACEDEERMYKAMRWFTKAHGHASDIYAYYNVLGRAFPRRAEFYNAGPNQKFWMRHVKGHDFALMTEKQRVKMNYTHSERVAFSRFQGVTSVPSAAVADPDGNPEKLKVMDPSLLCFYGHLLGVNGSWSNALNYFLRAHHSKPREPLILLSIASAYIQLSMKRTTDSRHWNILTGLSFLKDYTEARTASAGGNARLRAQYEMEAAFNEGRLLHFLGLAHLSWKCYERCLAVEVPAAAAAATAAVEGDGAMDTSEDGGGGVQAEVLNVEPDYKMEAALAMQHILLMAGDADGARKLGEKWLVF